ncbi:MAG: FlgD immunoglobulin-like domain containing protein [bacterium]
MKSLINFIIVAIGINGIMLSPLHAGIICGPYLQMPSSTSMGIAWETQNAVGGAVKYGLEGGGILGTVNTTSTEPLKYVELTSLLPATRYWYQVISDGDNSGQWVFRTAPDTGDRTQETRIVLWSDMQHWDYNIAEDGSYLPETPSDLIERVHTAKNLSLMCAFGPHLQFVLGDMAVFGYPKEWRHIFKELRPLCATAPLMGVQGNHDFADKSLHWRNYFHLPENCPAGTEESVLEIAYSFVYGNIHFTALPYEPSWKRPNYISWIKQNINKNSSIADWNILGEHTGWEGGAYNAYLADIDTAEGFDIIASGHSHTFHRSFPIRPGKFWFEGEVASANRNYYNGSTPGFIFLNTGTMGSYGQGNTALNLLSAAADNTKWTFSTITIKGRLLICVTYDDNGNVVDSFRVDKSDLSNQADPLPNISNIKTEIISGYAARITWNTDITAYSSIEYAPVLNPAALKTTPIIRDRNGNNNGTQHTVCIFGLSPAAEYQFRVKNRRDTTWVKSDLHTFITADSGRNQLVMALDFHPLRDFHVGGTAVSSAAGYEPQIGYGWIFPFTGLGESFPEAYYTGNGTPPESVLNLTDPTGTEARYRMARSRINVANAYRQRYQLDLPDGDYQFTFGFGTIMTPGVGRVEIQDRAFRRTNWPGYEAHVHDWPFIAKNTKTIRTADDAWEGEDEWTTDVSVSQGKIEFYVGDNDGKSTAYWEGGLGICYLIVRTPSPVELNPALNFNKSNPEFYFAAYPNPFTSNTCIRYIFNTNASMQLRIFRPDGRSVRILETEKSKPGIHSVVWDGLDNHGNKAGSGTYIIYLANENRCIKMDKVTIIR